MSAFGTKKAGSDVNIQLGFPSVFQDAYASGRDTLRFFPSAPMAKPEVYAGDDLLAEVHQHRKREADHMVRAKVHSRKMMNARGLGSHAGYYGMPQAVLGQRKFANPSNGAFILNSSRQDYRDAPFNFEGSSYEGSGLTGGVLRTTMGAQFVKTKLQDRIAQLQRIEEEKNIFLGALPGMPGMPGAMPSAPRAMTETPMEAPSESSAIELNLLFQNIEDSLAGGTGKDGLDRITYGEALRILTLSFRYVPYLDDDEIDYIINRVQRILRILNGGFLDESADLENLAPGVYQRAFTLNELYEKLNSYLQGMKAATANPTNPIEIPASPDTYDAYGNVIRGNPRVFIPGGNPSRNIAGSKDRVELSKALVKSLGFAKLMGRAVDVAKVATESRARGELGDARRRLAPGGDAGDDSGDDGEDGPSGGGGGARGVIRGAPRREDVSFRERVALFEPFRSRPGGGGGGGGGVDFSRDGRDEYAAAGEASQAMAYADDDWGQENPMGAAMSLAAASSRFPTTGALARASAGRASAAGMEDAIERQQQERDSRAAAQRVDVDELEGLATGVDEATGAQTLLGRSEMERQAGVARATAAQAMRGDLGEARAVGRASARLEPSPAMARAESLPASASASSASASASEEEAGAEAEGKYQRIIDRATDVEDLLKGLWLINDSNIPPEEWTDERDDEGEWMGQYEEDITRDAEEYVEAVVREAREKGWSDKKIIRQMKDMRENGYTMFDDWIAENEPKAEAAKPKASAASAASAAPSAKDPKRVAISMLANKGKATTGPRLKAWINEHIVFFPGSSFPSGDYDSEVARVEAAVRAVAMRGESAYPELENAIRKLYYYNKPEWKTPDGLNMRAGLSAFRQEGLDSVVANLRAKFGK